MMKGNWHYIAFSAFFSVLALKADKLLLIIILLFTWLIYLYLFKRINLFVVSLTIVSFVCFYLYFPSYERDRPPELPSSQQEQTIFGHISSNIKQTNKLVSFTFHEEKTNQRILVTYFYPQSSSENQEDPFVYMYRSSCKITGKLEQPTEATNPYEFDYRKYLFEQGITSQLIVNSLDKIECERKSSILANIYSVRDRFIKKANDVLHPEIAAWQQALIFGNSEELDEEVELLFQRWGLSHLLAISGLHVGIIIVIVYILLIRFVQVTREKANVFVFMFLPIYALLAGGQPSVWRASLMTVVVLLLSTKQIKISRLDILSIVFIGLILANKFIIYHIGFQFSFAVTLGLILSAKWFQSSGSYVETVFQISFIAQMMIVPLQMYYFYHFQPLSILLNVIIVPYFSLFVIPSMFFSFLLYIMPTAISRLLEQVFLSIHDTVMNGIVLVDQYVNTPFISGEITLAITIIYYILLYFMMIALEYNQQKPAFYAGVSICLLLTYIIAQPYLSKTGSVTMLDVGQGDAYVFELPYRRGVFLIDAGATFDFESFEPKDTVYKRVIRPYLMGRGIGTIDAIFVSHPHLDHHGSVRFILEEFDVHELFIDEFFQPDDKELIRWLDYPDLKITKARAQEEIKRKGHLFYVLSPQRDTRDKNDNSLVLYTRIGQYNWLFTGDISEAIEREVIDTYEQLQVDVLKVAHHGSKTSTAEQMLEKLQPEVALVPVGRNNRYGHPAKEVIDLLEEYGVKVYRADEDGAVQYKYRNEKMKIIRFND